MAFPMVIAFIVHRFVPTLPIKMPVRYRSNRNNKKSGQKASYAEKNIKIIV
jgi:hypothetical protein